MISAFLNYIEVSKSIKSLRIASHPINLTNIQRYAPTSTYEEEVIICVNRGNNGKSPYTILNYYSR